MEQIYFAKVRAEAIIPSRRTEDAGFDLYACFAEDTLYFAPGETRVIPTGIASAFDAGFYFQVKERGSTGVLGMAVRAGVIDSGYRGEWFIPITNLSAQPLYL
ncbi:MAG: dUTP pyrophosphatase, partial [Clostridia bacterium]